MQEGTTIRHPQSLSSDASEDAVHRYRFAWTIPGTLILGIIVTMALHLPLTFALLGGYIWVSVYSRRLFPWSSIAKASMQGILMLWKVGVVLLLVGAVVSMWMANGVIGHLVLLGSHFIRPDNMIWMAFLMTALLSMVIGSSIATWSVLGPPLMAMAPPSIAAMVAGAIISGGMVGDRGSPMSTSVLIISSASDVNYRTVLRQLNKTAILPFILTLAGFMILNHQVAHVDSTSLVAHIVNTNAWWLIVPPMLVIFLAILRVPLLYNLSIAAIFAWVMTFLQHVSGHDMALFLWYGYPVHANLQTMRVGGLKPMLLADALVFTAGAFQGVVKQSGTIDWMVSRAFRKISRPFSFVSAAYATCVGFSALMGSQMLSVLMSGNALKPQFQNRNLSNTMLAQMIADSAELAPAIIPWNLLGIQAYAMLHVEAFSALPFAVFVWGTMILSLITMGLKYGSNMRKT